MYAIALSLLVCHVGLSLGCWGGSTWPKDEPGYPWSKRENFTHDNPKFWGGHKAPPGAQEAWAGWLKNYRDQNRGKGGFKDPDTPGAAYGAGIPGFPDRWKDLGAPMEGVNPPPWAYVPVNVGKPSYCYLPPERGDCSAPNKTDVNTTEVANETRRKSGGLTDKGADRDQQKPGQRFHRTGP